MQTKSKRVVAIACADIHLSHLPPIARAGEPDWYAAMARPLRELTRLQDYHEVPILCAGDIFHHWKAPPELINFAMEEMPFMAAIPGQHDLPLHSYADMHKSAYTTLAMAGKLVDVKPGELHLSGINLAIYGFPWGFTGTDVNTKPAKDKLNIALHHAYRGLSNFNVYENAPSSAIIRAHEYEGFDTVIIGDNHIPFDVSGAGPTIFNCGSLMRRNSDQVKHRPRVGLVYSSGSVKSHYLNCSMDVFAPISEPYFTQGVTRRIDNLLDELNDIQKTALDFPEALRQAMNRKDVTVHVREILLKALENVNGK